MDTNEAVRRRNRLPDAPPASDRIGLGHTGEEAALASYRRAGFRLLARNWRCAIGEIDLVLRRGRVLVFCEVKTRRGDGFGSPFEAVTWKKQRKVRLLAEAFLREAREGLSGASEFRFDVASVTIDRAGQTSLHVFEGAF